MDEPNQKDVTDYGRKLLNPFAVKKPKKRSLVERELETNMTARMISPVTVAEGASTSRYGRARLNKSRDDSPKAFTESLKTPKSENMPVKVQSPFGKVKVNSHYKTETPQKALKTSLDNINNICQDNKTRSRFSIDKVLPSSTQNTQKVYIRQDLIQNRDGDDDNIVLIKDLFSKSAKKKNKVVERSTKKTPSFGKQNGHIENASVVKALDFDDNKKDSSSNKRISDSNKNGSGCNKRGFNGNKKIKESNESPSVSSKDTISYEEGDLVWARMGTFPFWPCIVTKDPESDMFFRKKLFGRVVHDILHVTYFADNGRRSWVVDNMLRKYMGLEEFLATREKFTSEDKKKDPRLYSAFFISEKKQSLWNTSVEEAEMINREPKSLRIDVLNDLLHRTRAFKKQHKSGKISRTNSDVSLSESLYDSLFSEDDSKTDDANRSRNKSRNKSLDVSDVVTACLDNMAVKTGNIKIQKQSHMDRWLQKAKSKTPEKVNRTIEQIPSTTPVIIPKTEIVTPSKDTLQDKMITPNVDRVARKVEKPVRNNKKKKLPSKEVKITKVYSLRRSYESQNALVEETETKNVDSKDDIKININKTLKNLKNLDTTNSSKDEPKTECDEEIASGNNSKDYLKSKVVLPKNNKSTADEDNDDVLNAINELLKDTSTSKSKDFSSKPLGAIADPINKTEVTELQIDIKPEIMDMDENPQSTIKDTDKPVVIAEDILDSPIKVEKELTLNDNLCSSMILDCDSPVKTENETSVERRSTNEDLEAKKNGIQEECSTTKILDVTQLSPTLKGNEMVSIPENALMTDDDCDSVTSMEYSSDVVDLQDRNSNLTNTAKTMKDIVVSTPKQNHDVIKTTENPDTLIKNIDIEQPDLSNKKQDNAMFIGETENKDIASTAKQDILIENLNIQVENHDLSKQEQDNIMFIDKIVNKDTASTAKQDILIENLDIQIKIPNLLNKKQDDTMLIDEIENKDITMSDKDLLNKSGASESIPQIDNDVTMNEKDLLNKSGASVSVLQTNVLNDVASDKPEMVKEPVDGVAKSELIETCKNDNAEESATKMKSDDNAYLLNSTEPKSFLGDSLNIDVYKDTTGTTTATSNFFLEKNIDKPPDLTIESIAAKTDLLNNVQNDDSEYDEESDDEPSPEYEPLGDDISEDFRQHMKCIESSITDKKDEAQLVKVCNEMSVIEESKSKLSDVIKSMNKISPKTSITTLVEAQNVIKEEVIKAEDLSENNKLLLSNKSSKQHTEDMPTSIKPNQIMNGQIKREKLACDGTIKIDLSKTPDQTKETKAEILDGLNIIKKAAENTLKSPPYKKKHNLSLKKEISVYHEDSKPLVILNDTVNPLYKTIDQIEEIIKSKPKRLPIDNFEVRIPEIKENGYYAKREINTPDRFDDDFDIDEASVNSEDSEVSSNQEKTPSRRSLRSRPAKKGGLQDPDFLNYMELRQDDLMEEHPELSVDDIVLYLYKTYTYSKNIESDEKSEELASLKSIKQETPVPSRKKSKKSSQPKNTIENFFRVKYNNAKRLDFDSESGTFDSNEDIKPKRETRSVSSSDSGIGNSKDSNESNTSITKKKSITKDVKVELINDAIIYKEASSPKTPKRLRKKTISPRVASLDSTTSSNLMSTSLDKRVPVVVISPMKDNRNVTKHKNNTETRHETITDLKQESITELQQEQDVEVKHERVTKTKQKPDVLVKHEPEASVVQKPDTIAKHKSDIPAKLVPETVLKLEPDASAKRQPDNIAKRKLETATKHKPDTEAKHNSENVPKHELITTAEHEPDILVKRETEAEAKHTPESESEHKPDTGIKHETESMDSDSELPLRKLRSKVHQDNKIKELKKNMLKLKVEIEHTAFISSDKEPFVKLMPLKADKSIEGSYEDPEFIKYVELKQDNIMEENPQLSNNEITAYLYKIWIYEKNSKSDMQKHDDIVSSSLVKGMDQEPAPTKKTKRKPKTEKNTDTEEIIAKDKPKRKTVSHYYNEAFISDFEDELEVFEIFKAKKSSPTVVSKPDSPKKERVSETKTDDTENSEIDDICQEINTLDEIELYFKQLTSPKPSVFKGLIREKVCEICEDVANLIKCKGCYGTFHYDCVTKVIKAVETPTTYKGRKKKKKVGRKPKNHDDSDQSEERDVSIDDTSIDEIPESITIDADTIESQLEAKMKELLDKETQLNYDSYSSDDGIDWTDTVPGKCELVDVKLKKRTPPIDYTNFKCNNCQKFDTPICFVCKSAVSKNGVKIRQKCNAAHCYSYYHLKCLDHWPQTQFNTGELTRSQKKTSERSEAFTCPRHVCHTCVSDDPRGCKTRFSGDKLAKCVRCPATYHSFNKCLPAGTQILTASLIICPRHYEHRPGKVPCHVNTGWCFICALGGSLICCEYCPTSFHAECLNIKPPEGNYMCEDCETGRLPLYEEMVWVKLGHYRWWPGVILHPSEIPDNIMAVKHGLGEFVVRFFGQYDHYWVNRGRVFPYQEGDSGRISSQKSKIDVAFTTAMEHAQRAFGILKNAEPDEDESLDIASSLLPPAYVKLKSNKPIGSLLGRKTEDPSLSLTQCECSPAEMEPCGSNSECINRMLLTECGPTCRAGDRCGNRAFEKRQYPKLTPYKALHRGWGLKTLEDIKAGQFVIEYVGELIDEEEFQRRMARQHEIRDENFYFLTLDKERMIDAGPKGNLARFMNHCCEPNCETQKWTVLGDIRVGLFAINDIKANSEVTFNYNLESSGIEKKRCLCGAKRCSGYIGAKPKQLDESHRKKNVSMTGKRKYTKRKNIDDSPSAVKNKSKKPLGRPPKPKELTEIEKDLLIIKNATPESSGESPRRQSVEEKNLKPLKKKIDSNTMEEGTVSSTESSKLDSQMPEMSESSKHINIDSKSMQEVPIPKNADSSSMLKRKLDLNTTEEVTISSEPSVKRQKCDKSIEVGD